MNNTPTDHAKERRLKTYRKRFQHFIFLVMIGCLIWYYTINPAFFKRGVSQAGAYIGQGRTLITGSSSTDSPVTAPLVQSEPTPTEPTPLADYPVQEELIEELEQPVSSDSTAEETINELTTEIERIIEDGELTPVVVDAPPAVPSINTGPLTFTLGGYSIDLTDIPEGETVEISLGGYAISIAQEE